MPFYRSSISFHVALCAVGLALVSNTTFAQLSDPIPATVTPSSITVGLELIATLPDTQADVNDGRNTNTRINFYRETDDGRRFINDQRGNL